MDAARNTPAVSQVSTNMDIQRLNFTELILSLEELAPGQWQVETQLDQALRPISLVLTVTAPTTSVLETGSNGLTISLERIELHLTPELVRALVLHLPQADDSQH